MKLKSQKAHINCITPIRKEVDCFSIKDDKDKPLPNEAIVGLQGLGEILRKVHYRLIREGYSIIEGKLYSPDGKLLYESKQQATTE